MFGRNKTEAPAAPQSAGPDGAKTSAKGRPTPKRSVAEAANKRPLVPSGRKSARGGGADRKTLARASREEVREQRIKQRMAMLSGDEAALPARDKGPQRRYVRDYIDARISVGELLLPLVAVIFLLTLTRQQSVVLALTVLTYGMVLAVVLDTFYVRLRLKKQLTAKFGTVQSGYTFYAFTRMLQIRRWRLPRPQVKRRQFPS